MQNALLNGSQSYRRLACIRKLSRFGACSWFGGSFDGGGLSRAGCLFKGGGFILGLEAHSMEGLILRRGPIPGLEAHSM